MSNGAKVSLLAKKTRASTINGSMTFHYGTAETLKGQQDVADLAMEMLFRGSQKLPYKEFRNKLESLKAQVQNQTAPQALVVNLEVKRPELSELLDVLADALTDPAFDAAEFDVLKKSQLADIEQAKNEPEALGDIELRRAVAPRGKDDPRYVETLAEAAAAVNAATLEQTRAFAARFVGAQNAEMALVGDFDPAEVKAKLEARFGKWSAKEKYVLAPDAFAESKAGELVIPTPDKAQAWMGFGVAFKGNKEGPDAAAMMVADMVFGGSPAARLFAELREKQGLSYGAYSMLELPEPPVGDRAVFAGFAIYAPQNMSKVESAFKKEYELLTTTGVKAAELEQQRKALLDQRQQRRASDRSLATMLSRNEQYGRTFAWEQQLDEKIKAVTVEQLNAAIKRSVDPKKLTVIKAGAFKTVSTPN